LELPGNPDPQLPAFVLATGGDKGPRIRLPLIDLMPTSIPRAPGGLSTPGKFLKLSYVFRVVLFLELTPRSLFFRIAARIEATEIWPVLINFAEVILRKVDTRFVATIKLRGFEAY